MAAFYLQMRKSLQNLRFAHVRMFPHFLQSFTAFHAKLFELLKKTDLHINLERSVYVSSMIRILWSSSTRMSSRCGRPESGSVRSVVMVPNRITSVILVISLLWRSRF